MNKPVIKDIHHAIAVFQQRHGGVVKDKKNAFKDYEYTSLGKYVASARESLGELGVATTNYVMLADGQLGMNGAPGTVWMKVELRHAESGTGVHTLVPLFYEKSTMQALKAAITSARKIGLCALLQLTDDDDDDDAESISGGRGMTVDAATLDSIKVEILRTGADLGKLLAYAKVADLDSLTRPSAIHVLAILAARPSAPPVNKDVRDDQ